jgi:metal-sulfur cluster biosynthetic enzyme
MSDNTNSTALEAAAREALRGIYDPELGINVVDLGLVVSLKEETPGYLDVTYRLTSHNCPIASVVAHAMNEALRALPGLRDLSLRQVDDPPWSPDCVTPEGRMLLGF